jgi:hypothetical protein
LVGAFDDRLVTLGIQVQGKTYSFDQRYFIRATGTKLQTGGILGEAEIRIDNIDLQTRNFLLTACSPYSQQTYQAAQSGGSSPNYPLVTLDVGRASWGTLRVFQGNCIAVAPTQPPDIGLTLKSLQGVLLLGQAMALTMPQNTLLSQLAQQVATANGLSLEFTATDKQIDNFSLTGSIYRQLQKLAECGDVDAFLDNTTLVVKDIGTGRQGITPVISSQTGMVTVPVVNERGLQAKCLINNAIKIGGQIQVQSRINPAANGTWQVYKLGFDISTWESPFYWLIFAQFMRLGFGYTP